MQLVHLSEESEVRQLHGHLEGNLQPQGPAWKWGGTSDRWPNLPLWGWLGCSQNEQKEGNHIRKEICGIETEPQWRKSAKQNPPIDVQIPRNSREAFAAHLEETHLLILEFPWWFKWSEPSQSSQRTKLNDVSSPIFKLITEQLSWTLKSTELCTFLMCEFYGVWIVFWGKKNPTPVSWHFLTSEHLSIMPAHVLGSSQDIAPQNHPDTTCSPHTPGAFPWWEFI